MDLIQYNVSDFINNKKINKEYDIIKTKYDIIYKNTCFSSKESFNNEYNKNYTKKPNTEVIKKDIGRSILGVLNVLNTRNYAKMLNQLRLLQTTKNIDIIIKEILSICTKQAFYLKLYIKLIEDIILNSLQTDKEKIYIIINDYISHSINEIEIYLKNDSKNIEYQVNKYDEFCDKQKEKNNIVSTNMIIINLFKKFKTNMNSCIYYDILKNILNTKLNDDKIILIIQLLIHIKNNDSNIKMDISINTNNNKRLQFLVEELNSMSFSMVKRKKRLNKLS